VICRINQKNKKIQQHYACLPRDDTQFLDIHDMYASDAILYAIRNTCIRNTAPAAHYRGIIAAHVAVAVVSIPTRRSCSCRVVCCVHCGRRVVLVVAPRVLRCCVLCCCVVLVVLVVYCVCLCE